MLWHFRLEHPSFQYLKYLFPTLFKGCSIFKCESCFPSKSHHITYLRKPYIPSKPFYLIHIDIWGPSKATTKFEKNGLLHLSMTILDYVGYT